MIIEIPDENSIVKWKMNDKEDWKSAEISDLIKAYERPRGEWIALDDNLCSLQRFKCSKCGHQIFCEPSKLSEYKGCYCGARMKGDAI